MRYNSVGAEKGEEREEEEGEMLRRRSSGTWGKCCLVVFAIVSSLCVCGPALYWKFKKVSISGSGAASACPLCDCDSQCPTPLPLFQIAPGLVSLAVPDCGKNDSNLNKEMEKQLADLLSEEIKLQRMVAEEHFNRMNVTLGEARRLGTQYQRESEKCNAATETCEQARERAEALITKEKKLTSTWEQRARQLGWQGE